MAGLVLSVDNKEGETTVPSNQGIAGSVLMTIADLNTIRARIAVDEASVGQVRSGQAVDLFPASEPDRSLRGRVERIELTPVRSAAGGSTSRAYAAEVSVEDPNGLLKPGLTTRAEIVVSAAERALSVPVSAIIPSESVNQSHVFLLNRGRLQQRTVRLGESDDTRQQVFGRIAAGDRVVIGPPRVVRSLRDGDAVVLAEGS
jgi:HlyD family secretion protein